MVDFSKGIYKDIQFATLLGGAADVVGVEPTNAPLSNVGNQPSGPDTPGEKVGPLLGWGQELTK